MLNSLGYSNHQYLCFNWDNFLLWKLSCSTFSVEKDGKEANFVKWWFWPPVSHMVKERLLDSESCNNHADRVISLSVQFSNGVTVSDNWGMIKNVLDVLYYSALTQLGKGHQVRHFDCPVASLCWTGVMILMMTWWWSLSWWSWWC